MAGSIEATFERLARGEGLAPHMALTVHSRSPWVVTIDGFLSADEADTILAAGANKGKGVPWFAFGFIGVATVNSVWGIPAAAQKPWMEDRLVIESDDSDG